MKAELKTLYSLSVPNIDSYLPKETDNFNIHIRLIVGPKGEDGEESFDLEICTPKWLLENIGSEDIFNGRHHLIVSDYSLVRITDYLTKYVESCSGKSWPEIAEKLSRLGHWEFEDYQT